MTYRTLAGRGESAFEVRGSEFIGRAAPVRDVEAAEAFVERVRGTHPDATHNVPAYRVRVDDDGTLREYANDDGEPAGSAGKPMRNVLQGEGVENVACVVTRYYGGTNLGVGGLVRAYGRATKEALEAGGITEVRPRIEFSLTVEYDDSGTVRGVLESADCTFEAEYGERVSFSVLVPSAERAALVERLRSATNGRADPK
jgi:uncharacterized YigZ family protein